jgi:hypothetical protein
VLAHLGLSLNRTKTGVRAMCGRSGSTSWIQLRSALLLADRPIVRGRQSVAEERGTSAGQGGDPGAGKMGTWEEVRDTLNRLLLRGW